MLRGVALICEAQGRQQLVHLPTCALCSPPQLADKRRKGLEQEEEVVEEQVGQVCTFARRCYIYVYTYT